MTPSLIVTPDVTPTAQLRTPEATPTLSPAQFCKMNSPNTQVASTRQARKLNKPTCRPRASTLFAGDEELAPANILAFNGAVNTDFAQPFVEDEFQGYLLDSGIVKASDGKDYLIADMVQESVRDGNGRSEQYVQSTWATSIPGIGYKLTAELSPLIHPLLQHSRGILRF